MTWVKLDDGFFDNAKVRGLSDKATLLYIASLTYAAQRLTDGCLDARAVRVLLATVDTDDGAVRELVTAWLWEPSRGEADYCIHDYLEYNPSAEQVAAIREVRQIAGQRGGQVAQAKRKQIAKQNSNPVPVTRNPLPVNPEPDSPEPPPQRAGVVFENYENEIGSLTPHAVNQIDAAIEEYGHTCLLHCIEEAVKQNKRSLSYVLGIAKRHKAEGCISTVVKNGAHVETPEEFYARMRREAEEVAAFINSEEYNR